MRKKFHWKKIREAEFTNIKKLTDARIPTTMVSKATGRSFYVVQLISKARSLAEYHTLITQQNGVTPKKKQSNPITESLGNVKPEERFPHLVTLLDTIVAQQLVLIQDVGKIKRRLLIGAFR